LPCSTVLRITGNEIVCCRRVRWSSRLPVLIRSPG
jgi:hypothetical protein